MPGGFCSRPPPRPAHCGAAGPARRVVVPVWGGGWVGVGVGVGVGVDVGVGVCGCVSCACVRACVRACGRCVVKADACPDFDR